MNNFFLRILSIIFLAPIILLLIYAGGYYFFSLLFVLFLIGLYEISFIKKKNVKIIIFIIFSFFIFSLIKLRFFYDSYKYIYFCLIITWLSDIGGYIFGKVIGGKKIKIISPNKTYSGFVGAIFLPFLSIFYLSYNDISFYEKNYYHFFLILILSLSSIIGDLYFSFIKRRLGIKDYSNIIPGHGGVFDRIDSLIFVIIIFYLIN